MTSFSIRNFGCRVNQAEAFDWTAEFQRRGWAFEPDADASGVVVLNTCTLTSRADRDVRKFIRRIARNNPKARIVVTGCLAERLPAETAALPGVWKVIPNSAKDALPSFVLTGGNSRRTRARPSISRGALSSRSRTAATCPALFASSPRSGARAGASLQTKVRARLTGFADRGFREVVLTGIHLSSYGRDLEPEVLAPRPRPGDRRRPGRLSRPLELARSAARHARAHRSYRRGEEDPPPFPSFAPARIGACAPGHGPIGIGARATAASSTVSASALRGRPSAPTSSSAFPAKRTRISARCGNSSRRRR